ncbi:MAG: diaminopimelate epimerase [Myxococcota bacterium]|nr:diaminopimelate epimerase [Myxococcota bacterium]
MTRFAKYHALGNDYLVMEAGDFAALGAAATPALSESAVARRLCERQRGVGGDGVLLRGPAADGFALRILNPDGSEAEKSGNGLRIFARYLFDRGEVAEAAFAVVTPGGRVRCQVLDGGGAVRVEMGRVSFHSRDVPVAGPPREVLREPIEVAGQALELSAATIGNPHCVVLRERLDPEETALLGPRLERDARFPNRTNVQLVRVVDRGRIEIEIWERGAGRTLASGSSSSAAAAVAHRLGLCDSEIVVCSEGGEQRVEIGPDFEVALTGPVTRVADGRAWPELLVS